MYKCYRVSLLRAIKREFLAILAVQSLSVDQFLTGYLTGAEDYFTHARCFGKMCGTDLRDNMDPANYTGVYSAHLFAQKASEVVKNHNTDKVYTSMQFEQAPYCSML